MPSPRGFSDTLLPRCPLKSHLKFLRRSQSGAPNPCGESQKGIHMYTMIRQSATRTRREKAKGPPIRRFWSLLGEGAKNSGSAPPRFPFPTAVSASISPPSSQGAAYPRKSILRKSRVRRRFLNANNPVPDPIRDRKGKAATKTASSDRKADQGWKL